MNISIKWLSEYLGGEPININKEEIKNYCDKMTYSGSKVESFEILFEELKNIAVGKLLSVEKHPDADKLSVCSVDVGESEPINIVTGAPNVKAGDIVPVALHNSVIHGGKKITKGKLRGVESCGMLCSIEELGLTKHDFPYAPDDGILVFEGDDLQHIKIGQDLKDAILLNDAVVEFEITPNRADCFSVIGLARESAVTLNRELKLHTPEIKREDKSDDIKNYLSVEVKNYDLCPRYSAKIIKDVKIAPSPLWLRAKLRASGVRPINNIVDITNYVMLEYGQPMHAFDYNYITGRKIIVRNADKDEKITTLDSNIRELDENMLVIADGSRPVALAGIMGGENSEISDATKTIVFESANFEKMSVRHTSRKLGLRTDSSANFEKGLDPHLTVKALDRACELVEILNCGTVVSGMIDEKWSRDKENYPPFVTTEKMSDILSDSILWDKAINFNSAMQKRINNLLGSDISREEMLSILEKLDFRKSQNGSFSELIETGNKNYPEFYDTEGSDLIVVPSYRKNDISNNSPAETAADLAEEISRIYGYGNIKNQAGEKITGYSVRRGGRDKFQKFLLNLHNALISSGYYETYTFSFVTPKYFDKLNLPENSNLRDVITIINPLGEDTSVMRTTLLPSTLATFAKNYANRNEYGYFYDIAKVYFYPQTPVGIADTPFQNGAFAADEKNMLSFGFYDTVDKSADFYALKGAVENVLNAAGIKNYRLSSDISGYNLSGAFHPGRSAVIISGEKILGIFGEIHPVVSENFDIGTKCYAAELDIDAIYENSGEDKKYSPLPKYPATTRDLALVCEENAESAIIYDIIKAQSGEIFESCKAFDVYKGDKIGEGKKSVAFAISFRHSERTLSDEEVTAVIDKILAELEKIDVVLRK